MSTRSLIIVPVDDSPETERTLQYAIGIARERGADVDALQVVPRKGTLWHAPENETTLRARLRALRPAAAEDGVVVRTVTLRGVSQRVIPAYAQLSGASVVIVDRRFGSSRRWRNSGVVSRLIRSSPVPVLVASTGHDVTTPLKPSHIMAAVDFTVASAVALRTAAEVSKQHGARLTMLHAMPAAESMVFSSGEAQRFAYSLASDADSISERLKRRAMAAGSDDAKPVVVTGNAPRGILDTAKRLSADLIVMGVAPRTWIDEMVSGSTLRAVLRHTRVPVLVLPVTGGSCQWIDEVEGDSVWMASMANGMTRHAA